MRVVLKMRSHFYLSIVGAYQGEDYKADNLFASKLLPDLDLNLLAQYVIIPDPLDAIIRWRKATAGLSIG